MNKSKLKRRAHRQQAGALKTHHSKKKRVHEKRVAIALTDAGKYDEAKKYAAKAGMSKTARRKAGVPSESSGPNWAPVALDRYLGPLPHVSVSTSWDVVALGPEHSALHPIGDTVRLFSGLDDRLSAVFLARQIGIPPLVAYQHQGNIADIDPTLIELVNKEVRELLKLGPEELIIRMFRNDDT